MYLLIRFTCIEENGWAGRQPGQGRKRKTSERDDRMIIREIKKNPFVTSSEVVERLQDLSISPRTVRRRIGEESDFKSCFAPRCPFINEKQAKARLEWCEQHKNWTPAMWEKVLWSDESPFVLRFNRKRRVWRISNSGWQPRNCVGTVKHDKKLNVWGCFSAHGVGRLYRIEGIMKKEDYVMILDNELRPSAATLFPDGNFIFQQDNDPKHTANIVKDWFGDNAIIKLEWPSQSPDLNPIENLWSILDMRLKDRKVNTLNELLLVLQDGWKAIPVETLRDLVHSMPKRIEAVIKAKGYATKY